MKRFLTLLVLVVPLLFVVACGGSESKPSDIQTAEQLKATSVAPSGASKSATTMAEVQTLMSGISASDTAVVDLMNELKTGTGVKGFLPVTKAIFTRALPGSKALSSSLQSQLDSISSAIEAFPTNKSLDVKLSASGEAMGQYFTLSSLSAYLTASATTTDGAAISVGSDGPGNLKSVSGEGQLSVSVDSHDLPADSCIKGIKLRANAGGTASATANADGSDGSMTFDYAESFCGALSVANADKSLGAKLVLSVEAKNNGTVASMASVSSPDAFVPSVVITLAIYDDANVQQFKQTYSSLAEFETAMGAGKK